MIKKKRKVPRDNDQDLEIISSVSVSWILQEQTTLDGYNIKNRDRDYCIMFNQIWFVNQNNSIRDLIGSHGHFWKDLKWPPFPLPQNIQFNFTLLHLTKLKAFNTLVK